MLHLKYKSLFEKYKINTPTRIAFFLGQLEHESGLKPISENLNYSASGLIRIFRKYFTDLEAIQFQRQPQKIANRVYANRIGNGDEKSGDGWFYRGRGFIQVTGKANYIELSKSVGIDFVKKPDLLLEEANALISALWFWDKHKLNNYADKNDVKGMTKIINGGYNGLEDRLKKINKWKQIL